MRCLNLLFLAIGSSLGTLCLGQTNEFVQGEVLVRSLTARADSPGLGRAHQAIGARSLEYASEVRIDRIALPTGMDVRDAVAYYESLPGVQWAEPNYLRELTYAPNDPEYPTQSFLRQSRFHQAWDITKGKTSVVIAVIDTGIDKSHPDLKGKIVAGWDFVNNDSDPSSTHSHGSHVAGIAAAATDNGIGISSAGFRNYVMPLRVGTAITAVRSANAMIYAADHGAKVISMSYAGQTPSQTEEAAVNYAWSKGCVLVAAAGNNSQNLKMYPSGYANVICVGSVNGADEQSSFTNWGSQNVDVAAPGENILSTLPGGYGHMTGTSMACPQVAGLIGLLWSSAGSGTTNTQIRNLLQNQCDAIGSWVKFGRINALKAVQAMNPPGEFISNPVTVQMATGSGSMGNLADILTTDTNYFQVQSVQEPSGQIASISSDVQLNGPAVNLRFASLAITSNGPGGSSASVQIYNHSADSFRQLRSIPLRPTGTNLSQVDLPLNLSDFIQNGKITIRLRAIAPQRPGRPVTPPFVFKLNELEIKTRPGL